VLTWHGWRGRADHIRAVPNSASIAVADDGDRAQGEMCIRVTRVY